MRSAADPNLPDYKVGPADTTPCLTQIPPFLTLEIYCQADIRQRRTTLEICDVLFATGKMPCGVMRSVFRADASRTRSLTPQALRHPPAALFATSHARCLSLILTCIGSARDSPLFSLPEKGTDVISTQDGRGTPCSALVIGDRQRSFLFGRCMAYAREEMAWRPPLRCGVSKRTRPGSG